jgi:hypothetical protein
MLELGSQGDQEGRLVTGAIQIVAPQGTIAPGHEQVLAIGM